MTEKDKKPVKKETSEPLDSRSFSSVLPDPEDDEDESGFCCSNPAHHKR